METQNLVPANNDRNANYRLYKGFLFLGGFETILQAKQYARKYSIEQEEYHSVYTLKGKNYTDQWSHFTEQTPETVYVVSNENTLTATENSVYEIQTILDKKIAEIAEILETMPDNSKTLQKVNLIKALDNLQNYANGINDDDFMPTEQPAQIEEIAVEFSEVLNKKAIEHYGKFKCYIQITACNDATKEQLKSNDTPEVEVIGYAGMFQGVRGYDLKNVVTGSIYRNISSNSFFTQPKK